MAHHSCPRGPNGLGTEISFTGIRMDGGPIENPSGDAAKINPATFARVNPATLTARGGSVVFSKERKPRYKEDRLKIVTEPRKTSSHPSTLACQSDKPI
jgi:hypothetical protein